MNPWFQSWYWICIPTGSFHSYLMIWWFKLAETPTRIVGIPPPPAHHWVGLRLQHPQEDLVEGRPKRWTSITPSKMKTFVWAARYLSCMQLIGTSNTPQFAPCLSGPDPANERSWANIEGPIIESINWRLSFVCFCWMTCLAQLDLYGMMFWRENHEWLQSYVLDVGQWRDVSRI